MDTTTTLIAGVIVLLCILPVFLMNESRCRRERRGKAILCEMAGKENTTLADCRIEQRFLIGISADKKLLFFARLGEKGEYSRFVFPLKDYVRCVVGHDEHQEGPKSERCTMIDRVWLSLLPAEQGNETANLVFYDNNLDQRALSDEMKIAEEWQRIIGNCL